MLIWQCSSSYELDFSIGEVSINFLHIKQKLVLPSIHLTFATNSSNILFYHWWKKKYLEKGTKQNTSSSVTCNILPLANNHAKKLTFQITRSDMSWGMSYPTYLRVSIGCDCLVDAGWSSDVLFYCGLHVGWEYWTELVPQDIDWHLSLCNTSSSRISIVGDRHWQLKETIHNFNTHKLFYNYSKNIHHNSC